MARKKTKLDCNKIPETWYPDKPGIVPVVLPSDDITICKPACQTIPCTWYTKKPEILPIVIKPPVIEPDVITNIFIYIKFYDEDHECYVGPFDTVEHANEYVVLPQQYGMNKEIVHIVGSEIVNLNMCNKPVFTTTTTTSTTSTTTSTTSTTSTTTSTTTTSTTSSTSSTSTTTGIPSTTPAYRDLSTINPSDVLRYYWYDGDTPGEIPEIIVDGTGASGGSITLNITKPYETKSIILKYTSPDILITGYVEGNNDNPSLSPHANKYTTNQNPISNKNVNGILWRDVISGTMKAFTDNRWYPYIKQLNTITYNQNQVYYEFNGYINPPTVSQAIYLDKDSQYLSQYKSWNNVPHIKNVELISDYDVVTDPPVNTVGSIVQSLDDNNISSYEAFTTSNANINIISNTFYNYNNTATISSMSTTNYTLQLYAFGESRNLPHIDFYYDNRHYHGLVEPGRASSYYSDYIIGTTRTSLSVKNLELNPFNNTLLPPGTFTLDNFSDDNREYTKTLFGSYTQHRIEFNLPVSSDNVDTNNNILPNTCETIIQVRAGLRLGNTGTITIYWNDQL